MSNVAALPQSQCPQESYLLFPFSFLSPLKTSVKVTKRDCRQLTVSEAHATTTAQPVVSLKFFPSRESTSIKSDLSVSVPCPSFNLLPSGPLQHPPSQPRQNVAFVYYNLWLAVQPPHL